MAALYRFNCSRPFRAHAGFDKPDCSGAGRLTLDLGCTHRRTKETRLSDTRILTIVSVFYRRLQSTVQRVPLQDHLLRMNCLDRRARDLKVACILDIDRHLCISLSRNGSNRADGLFAIGHKHFVMTVEGRLWTANLYSNVFEMEHGIRRMGPEGRPNRNVRSRR